MSEGTGKGPMSGSASYVGATLVMVGVVIALTGAAVEPAAGMVSAWAIQGFAFRRLVAALDAGRDATRAWLGGIWGRGGGLIAVGIATFAGLASPDLPVAYALAMLGLMLVEAAWLYGRLSGSRHRDRGTGAGNGIEGTHTTG